jgi:hypothetical protein
LYKYLIVNFYLFKFTIDKNNPSFHVQGREMPIK